MDLTLIISGGILIGCFLALSWFAGSDAPFIPTRMDNIRKVLKLAGIKRGKRFYELGSGDGRVVLEAAKLGADSLGIEQSFLRVIYSKMQAKKLNIKNAKFAHGDIFSRNFSDGNIIYIYLLPKGVRKLEETLRSQLKKGSVVITQTYHFSNWRPFKKIDLSKEIDYSKNIKGAGNFWLYRR